ncbi:Predicted membrane protein [Bordetella pertussis]|nr:Predicted membrane protein [Bordetella pertussis]
MALTNYLLQSLVCAVLFTAWGLRWVGTLAPLSVLGLHGGSSRRRRPHAASCELSIGCIRPG